MGELDQRAREKGFQSLRDLAFKITPSPGEHQPTYIANKVRELDRGKDDRWWTGTGRSYLTALLDELDMSESELLGLVKSAASQGETAEARNVWPFDMFPALRSLDLKNEGLFPGIPPELTARGGPSERHSWWVAPSGAGKTLLGRWLEVRFGWTVLTEKTWAEALQRMPSTGRVYLELDSAEGAPATTAAISPDVRLCVASSAAAPGSETQDETERRVPSRAWARGATTGGGEGGEASRKWHVVRSQSSASWMGPLVEWVAARVRGQGGFARDDVRVLMDEPGMANLIATPGEAIDLFGVIDVVGIRRRAGHVEKTRWAETWIQSAAARADRGVTTGMAGHLRKQGFDVLVDATKARMLAGRAPVMTADDWGVLIPPREGGDYAELYAIAQRNEVAALEEIRRRLRPDGAAWVAAYRSIGLLIETRDGLALRPEWLARVVEETARATIIEEDPMAMGGLLLHASTVQDALDDIRTSIRAGDMMWVKAARTISDAPTAESLALLDGVVRAAGLHANLMEPADAGALWNCAIRHTHRGAEGEPPAPLLRVASLYGSRGVTSLGCWFLAMLALSKRAGQANGAAVRLSAVPHESALDPWARNTSVIEQERLVFALEQATAASRRTEEHAEITEIAELARSIAGQLLDGTGVLARDGRVLESQVPELVVQLSRRPDLQANGAILASLLDLPGGLPALREACQRRGASLQEALAWCWRGWASQANIYWLPQFVLMRAKFREEAVSPDGLEVWGALRAEHISHSMWKLISDAPQIWPALSDSCWERCVELWLGKEPTAAFAHDAFRVMPERHLLRAVREGTPDYAIKGIAWERIPEEVFALLDEYVNEPVVPGDTEKSKVELYAWFVNNAQVPRLVECVRFWLEHSTEYPRVETWAPRWLQWIVDLRKPGWRDALEVLVRHHRAP